MSQLNTINPETKNPGKFVSTDILNHLARDLPESHDLSIEGIGSSGIMNSRGENFNNDDGVDSI